VVFTTSRLKAGGILAGTTDATGKVILLYHVLISAKTAVGDGFCLAAGGATGTCWIQAETPTTNAPIAEASFVTL
jgi:hypothetical protein